jgi:hypothetical protein
MSTRNNYVDEPSSSQRSVRKSKQDAIEKMNLNNKQATKETINLLIEQGFIPKHNSNDPTAALQYLLNIVANFPRTKLCTGLTEWKKWFEYLLKEEQFHPSVCTGKGLYFEMTNNKVQTAPSQGEKKIKDMMNKINQQTKQTLTDKKCTNSNLIIPLNVLFYNQPGQTTGSGHANMIMINRDRQEYEWFEPVGFHEDISAITTMRDFVKTDLRVFLSIPKKYKFVNSYGDECSIALGPQHPHVEIKLDEEECKNGGYCITYSTLYAHLRMLAPDCSPEESTQALMDLSPKILKNLVLRYVGWQEQALKLSKIT